MEYIKLINKNGDLITFESALLSGAIKRAGLIGYACDDEIKKIFPRLKSLVSHTCFEGLLSRAMLLLYQQVINSDGEEVALLKGFAEQEEAIKRRGREIREWVQLPEQEVTPPPESGDKLLHMLGRLYAIFELEANKIQDCVYLDPLEWYMDAEEVLSPRRAGRKSLTEDRKKMKDVARVMLKHGKKPDSQICTQLQVFRNLAPSTARNWLKAFRRLTDNEQKSLIASASREANA